MNICLLCYRGNPYCGGQGGYLYFLSRELARMGHRVTVLVGSPRPWPMPWAKTVHVENLNLWGVRQNFIPAASPWRLFRPLNFLEFGATRLGFFPEMLIFSIRAFRWLHEHRRELSLHVIHDVQSLGYGVLLMKRFGLPLFTTVHHPLTVDFHASLERHRNFRERYYTVAFYPLGMQGRVIRRCDRVITSSRQSAGEIESAFGVPAGRLRMVYNGLDTEFFRPADGGTGRDAKRILFVGNTDDPKKGVLYLFQALALLPGDISLTIVDEGRPRKAYAPGLVEKMGLPDRVAFTGKVSPETLRRLYTSAALVVLPSLYEGFGLPAAEAMACGTPVVATRAGALPEVVGDGAGVLVPPRDPQALARGILHVLGSEEEREKMGRKGRQRVEELFTWRKVAERTVEVYKELVASDE